jgi:hypothetical protein
MRVEPALNYSVIIAAMDSTRRHHPLLFDFVRQRHFRRVASADCSMAAAITSAALVTKRSLGLAVTGVGKRITLRRTTGDPIWPFSPK